MQRLSKVFLGVSLATLSSVVFAQNSAPPPAPAPGLVSQPGAPTIPAGTPTLSLDTASFTYLPWIGQNLASLVNYQNFFYQQEMNAINGQATTYNPNVTMAANIQLTQTIPTTTTAAANLTSWDVQSMLPYGGSSTVPLTLVQVPGTDTKPYASPPTTTPATNNNPNDAFLNGDTIMGVMGYDNSQGSPTAKAIQQFIQFLTGQAQAPAGLVFSTDSGTAAQQMQSADVQQYLLESRTIAAAQSVGMSNIHFLAQERAIVPGLGASAGMTTLPTDNSQPQAINDASQLQLEQFLVDRRVGNKAWYAAVNTENSIAVQRETLFAIAEISKEIFQQRLIMERMLAEEVAMQQLAAQINQAKLQFDQQTVQQGLSSTTGGTSTSTSGGSTVSYSPPSTTSGGSSSSTSTTSTSGGSKTSSSTQTNQVYQQALSGIGGTTS